MYLADVSLFSIKCGLVEVALAFITVGEIQTTTAETVRRSQNATVSALATSGYLSRAQDDTSLYTILCSVLTGICTFNIL